MGQLGFSGASEERLAPHSLWISNWGLADSLHTLGDHCRLDTHFEVAEPMLEMILVDAVIVSEPFGVLVTNTSDRPPDISTEATVTCPCCVQKILF